MVILFIALFLLAIVGIFLLQKKKKSFNVLVIVGLLGGIVFGLVINFVVKDAAEVSEILKWTSIIGNIYVRLLKMMAIPLIFVSITCAIINQKAGAGLGKLTGIILVVLLGTAAIAATVGGVTAKGFNLSAEGLAIGETQAARGEKLEETAAAMASFDKTLVEIVPTNPIYALSGQGSSATLSVVLFACLLGVAIRGVATYNEEQAEFFSKLMNSANTIVVELVMMILQLTPYAILSLLISTVAGSDYASLASLGIFVLASYVAMLIMFVIHGIILAVFKMSPFMYFKKAMTALTFAFTSRTSAGTLPLTIRTLTEKMGVEDGTSNMSASLAISIGQNGCGAIYPMMLVIMVAPVVGQEITVGYFIQAVLIVTIASIGIAGVGGGATFAGITVLTALGLPVGLAGVLVAVEPMIDMMRTALNVSDGMIAGLVAGKVTKNINMDIYNDPKQDFIEKGHIEKPEL